jgi:hypothetical protein
MVSISSSDCWASVTTSAVISLVSEAIGSTASEFLLKRTSSVSWSSTSAALDLRSSASCVERNPAIWPYDGRAGTTATERMRLMLRAEGWTETAAVFADRFFFATPVAASAAEGRHRAATTVRSVA